MADQRRTVAAAPSAARKENRSFRRIATEEAFATPEQFEAMVGLARGGWDNLDLWLWKNRSPDTPNSRRLLDLGEERLRIMDEHGVDMQVLSLTSPGVQMLDADTATRIASIANDRLAEAIQRHPTRFAGLAAFAPQDPARAVKEMERAIGQLELNGFILNSHTEGEYLDNPKYRPILEAAEALEAPIYIHPRSPSDLMAPAFRDYGLERAVWGYHAETGLHAMRIVMSGVLDRLPRLKIVLGHMGEGIPFYFWRMDNKHQRKVARLEMKPSEYFKRNFVITTSGVFHHPALMYSLEVLGAENVMWAIDYPYEDTRPAVEFMDSAPVSDEVRAKLYHQNAERVFRIAAQG